MKSTGSLTVICAIALAGLTGCNWNDSSSSAQSGASSPLQQAALPSMASAGFGTVAENPSGAAASGQAPTTDGNATLTWLPPTSNTDGSVITDLAGYRIYYGTNQDALSQVVDISNVGVTTYIVQGLTTGTWYFAVRAYTVGGSESALSNIASKSIT